MSPRRDKRRYGREAKDVRRGGIGVGTPAVTPDIKDINFWIRINGVDVANSNSVHSSNDLTEDKIVSFSHIVNLQAGDYVQLMFAVNDVLFGIEAFTATGVGPATPSVMLNVMEK